MAGLPVVLPISVHPYLSTAVPQALPLLACPLLELPSLSSVPFLTVPFCVRTSQAHIPSSCILPPSTAATNL